MNRKCIVFAKCLIALLFIVNVGRAEVVARCGKGYLELVDGYRVLHVKGTPYEMGYQHGTLLSDDCKEQLNYLFNCNLKEKSIDYLGLNLPVQQAISASFAAQR